MITRRSLLAAGTLAGLGLLQAARAEPLPLVTVNKDPNCGCCGAWADHLRAAGFPVKTVETQSLRAVKHRLGVPAELSSCHTAEVAGYVIEGHVPAPEIARLLREKPAGKGLAVPEMPIGSPGMEVEGSENETYDVLLFGDGEPTVFARYKGSAPVQR
ncbi:MAG: DUF411 domain-containing protein [Rhodomicrobium sp.]|nr:DUF411 domain-containing protein [Rhodomicrobium sp.]